MPIEKSAGAVIFYCEKHGAIKYLVLQHNKNYWNFPKGRIEKGEDGILAMKREVEEETGIKEIKIIPNFQIKEKYFYRASKNYREIKKRGKIIFKKVIFYLAEVRTKKVIISFEHKSYEWLGFKEALDRLKYRASKEILERANDFLMELET